MFCFHFPYQKPWDKVVNNPEDNKQSFAYWELNVLLMIQNCMQLIPKDMLLQKWHVRRKSLLKNHCQIFFKLNST